MDKKQSQLVADAKGKPRARGGLNVYLNRDIYRTFSETCTKAGVKVSGILDGLMQRYIDDPSGKWADHAPTKSPKESNKPPVGPKAELIALIQDADEAAIQTMLNVMKPMLEMAANKAKSRKI